MSPIDVKRKELELVRISAARAEMEFKIMEKEEEVDRLKANIQIQLVKEAEIKDELKKLKT